VLRALRDRTGCLLRNHGTIVYGDDLDQAYDRTAQLEWMCQVWLAARSVQGFSPSLLSKRELARVAEKLRGYGQPDAPAVMGTDQALLGRCVGQRVGRRRPRPTARPKAGGRRRARSRPPESRWASPARPPPTGCEAPTR
jgi:hypothetical protein